MEEYSLITKEDVLEVQDQIYEMLLVLPMYEIEINRFLKTCEPISEEEVYSLKHYKQCIKFREFLLERIADVFRGYPN